MILLPFISSLAAAQGHRANDPNFGAFALIVLAVLTPYFLLIQLRRLRYRRLADRLSAQYQSQGLFKTGRIVGQAAGQEFTIETFVRGRPAYFSTSVSMACNTRAIDLPLGPPASGGIHLSLITTSVPLKQSRDPKLQELLSGFTHSPPSLRKGTFDIKAGHVRWVTRGILADDRQIKMVVPLIQQIAKAIEASPNA